MHKDGTARQFLLKKTVWPIRCSTMGPMELFILRFMVWEYNARATVKTDTLAEQQVRGFVIDDNNVRDKITQKWYPLIISTTSWSNAGKSTHEKSKPLAG